MTELIRYEAARRALAEAVKVDEVAEIRSKAEAMRVYARQAGDKELEIQAAQIRFRAEVRLGELLIAAKEAGQVRGGRPEKNPSDLEGFSDEAPISRVTLREAGIDHKLSSRAQRLATMDRAELEQALERHAEEMRSGHGRVAMDLLKVGAEEKGRAHRRNVAAVLSAQSAELPDGPMVPAVYLDPPWRRQGGIGDRAYENHYPTMTWPEILDYLRQVAPRLLPDSWAFMWIPRPHLLALVEIELEVTIAATGEVVPARVDMPLAWACARALAMDSYSTCFVWTKTDADFPDDSGSGLITWDQDELLLLFKRGQGLPKPSGSEKFGSNHRERPREHSRKPDFYRHMIATMVGCDAEGRPLPVLELFARVDAEHPLPPGWLAAGNQAVVAQGAIDKPTDVAPSPSSAGASSSDGGGEAPATAERPAGTGDHPAEHDRGSLDSERSIPTLDASRDPPCARDRGHAGEVRVRKEAGVATGSSEVFVAKLPPSDDPVFIEWKALAAIDARVGVSGPAVAGLIDRGLVVIDIDDELVVTDEGLDRMAELEQRFNPSSPFAGAAPSDAGETEAAAADATEGASPAAAVADVVTDIDEIGDRAPYDDSDVIQIDQLAGSDYLQPAELDALELEEIEQLTILSDFCHPKRALCDVLGPHWLAREMAYQASGQWALRAKGWDRLRELEAADAAPAAKVVTEPYRAPQMSLFDAARQIDDAPPPEVVDGALQTRLPIDDDELAEQLALLAIDAGGAIEPHMLRHLVGKGFAHCGLTKNSVTDDGRAFLAQLVGPASVQQQGETAR